jgi:hypothetical protein
MRRSGERVCRCSVAFLRVTHSLAAMTGHAFVPDDFIVPVELVTPRFRLEPLGTHHNADDHAAWSSSVDHIRATPGFESRSWPPAGGMALEANLADLQQHADDFARRTGFTYSVVEPADGGVIGCVYIYPSPRDGVDAEVRSWVRADRAELDALLHRAVSDWLAALWPFGAVQYAPRHGPVA